jgi:hypothetical protein
MQFRKELVQRALTLVTLAAFVATMLITPGITSAQVPPPAPRHGALTVPITGGLATLPDASQSTFTGSFTIQRFIAQNGKLFALGTVVGQTAGGRDIVAHGVQAEVTDIRSIGTPTASNNPPNGFQQAQAACPILHLALGPINLNLLGLVVTTNQIVVDIVAQPGPGNLLGNLLCAVANLLNPNGGVLSGLLNQVVALLNQILAQLGAVAQNATPQL